MKNIEEKITFWDKINIQEVETWLDCGNDS